MSSAKSKNKFLFSILAAALTFGWIAAIEVSGSANGNWHSVETWELAASTNGSTTAPQTAPFNWAELLQTLVALIPCMAVGLNELRKLLKDRNWRKKYEKVIVTKPPLDC